MSNYNCLIHFDLDFTIIIKSQLKLEFEWCYCLSVCQMHRKNLNKSVEDPDLCMTPSKVKIQINKQIYLGVGGLKPIA